MSWTTPLTALPHLSDEAVAAFADGVLSGPARQRAQSHMAGCGECSDAVYGQRSASAILRSASAPSVPIGLLERLRELPITAQLPAMQFPSGLSADGQPMFAAFAGPSPAAEAGSTGFGTTGFHTAPLPSDWSGPPATASLLTPPAERGGSAQPAGAQARPDQADAHQFYPDHAHTGAHPHQAHAHTDAHSSLSGHHRRRASARAGLSAAAVAVVAVGVLASTAAAAGGMTTGRQAPPSVRPSSGFVVPPSLGQTQPALLTFIPSPR